MILVVDMMRGAVATAAAGDEGLLFAIKPWKCL
jgi:hypothetical protein